MFENIKFTNPFSKLPSNFYTKQSWSSFDQPFLLHFNHDLAKSLGIQDNPEELMQIFNGSKNFSKSSPLTGAISLVIGSISLVTAVESSLAKLIRLKDLLIFILKVREKLLIQGLVMVELLFAHR